MKLTKDSLIPGVRRRAVAVLGAAALLTGFGMSAASVAHAAGTGQVTGYQGMCLDVRAAGTADGTAVQVYSCNGTGAQVWVPQSNGELVNPNSGKCLDDTGFGGSGTQVQIWACADSSNQQWKLP